MSPRSVHANEYEWAISPVFYYESLGEIVLPPPYAPQLSFPETENFNVPPSLLIKTFSNLLTPIYYALLLTICNVFSLVLSVYP